MANQQGEKQTAGSDFKIRFLSDGLNASVEKNYLYPAAPPLTRFTETVMPVMKKKLLESTVLDDNIVNKLNELTISKLCVRLNTLQYIQKQIGVVEDGIQNSWALVRLSTDKRLGEKEPTGTLEKGFLTDSEAVHELFATTFNSIKDTTKIAINKICDFIGELMNFFLYLRLLPIRT
ncbi:uncharacterized protein LOC110808722 [Carica papaya]|uniref:uncharacterized protein LOC110808722 n=1 Tax=Carica papaya TaxID=3649 RepID=UPI000B8D12AB|nr:uncharacterized protein LOC110808722 [Carica papaya]